MFGLFLTKNYDMASDNLEYSARVICGPLLLYVGDNFYGVFLAATNGKRKHLHFKNAPFE